MLLSQLKVLKSHGKQYIPDLEAVELPATFRGRPELTRCDDAPRLERLAGICPAGAIGTRPFSLDLGRCLFCKECAFAEPELVRFTPDYRLGSTCREDLVITPESGGCIEFGAERVRREIVRTFGHALKLRQVSAGGDASTEMELNATGNVNFDLGRYGIEFTASPRHADGVVITGPVTANMAEALEICYQAVAEPKLIVAAGSEAISGGLFAESKAVDRSFFERHRPDLFLPGNPVHPMTFIEGIMRLTGRWKTPRGEKK